METAFQPDAFQNDAFQIAPAVVTGGYSGTDKRRIVARPRVVTSDPDEDEVLLLIILGLIKQKG